MELRTAPAQGASRLDRMLTMEMCRVTEAAAVAASRLRGHGDEKAADQAAVDAMRRELNNLPIRGRVVIGEGERDEAPMLYIGEEVGTGDGPEVDIALDPLEGTTLCAKNQANALAVIAIGERGNLLFAPDVYMDKIAIGPGFAPGLVGLDRSPTENLRALADAKGVPVERISTCVMDRPRHAELIEEIRACGASIRLISDGDVAGIIHTSDPATTGIDMYIGIGAAPEGVLAASALRCMGGQMQGRLILDTDEKLARAERMGVSDAERIYDAADLAAGDVLFAATGVTDGNLLRGVKFTGTGTLTHTVAMRSRTGTVRWIEAMHQDANKFE